MALPINADVAGFAAAQQKLRANFGETVWFIQPDAVTFPPGTNLDPSTGKPYDPAIVASTTVTPSASAACTPFFRAATRSGSGHEYFQGGSDIRNFSLVMLITDIANKAICQGAIKVLFRGDYWKVMAEKPDGIGAVQRWLTYIKQI